MQSSRHACTKINYIMWKAHKRVRKQSVILQETCKTKTNDDSCKIAWGEWNKRMGFYMSIVKANSEHCRILFK